MKRKKRRTYGDVWAHNNSGCDSIEQETAINKQAINWHTNYSGIRGVSAGDDLLFLKTHIVYLIYSAKRSRAWGETQILEHCAGDSTSVKNCI